MSLMSAQAKALDADFLGYFRGGTGLNLQGGKQECFNNQGIPGNFMRLGNECTFYGELALAFHHKRPTVGDSAFFRTQLRLMTGAEGTRQWEPAANRDINQIEAYVVAGGLQEFPADVWVGKRFYRDVDLHIFDWYYYADMSGVGAGLENIKLGTGSFAVAHLIQTNDDVDTNVGKPTLQAIDLRWRDVPAFGEQKINFWGVYAWAPGSSDGTTEYVPTNGYSIASRLNGPVAGGNNNTSLMFGKGTMKDFNIYGSSAVSGLSDNQNRAWNILFVEDWTKEVTDRWAFMVGLAGEYGDTGDVNYKQRYFYEAGIRPIYFVTDRFQWVFETGFSRIQDDTERDGSNPLGARDMTRVTVAPQLSFSKSIWGRPVLRAFLTHSVWNSANSAKVATSAPTFADKTAGTSFGYQFEAWF
jgi:maltoporin